MPQWYYAVWERPCPQCGEKHEFDYFAYRVFILFMYWMVKRRKWKLVQCRKISWEEMMKIRAERGGRFYHD